VSMAQLPLSLTPPRRAGFDNFVPGPNRSQIAALRAGAADGQWFYLTGPSGCGKSHLASALYDERLAQGASACLIPAASRAGRALLAGAAAELVLVDDVEHVAGDAEAERALFNLLNRARASRSAVVLTGSGAVCFALPDLRSRVAQFARLKLVPLDEQALAALIDRLLEDFELIAGRGLTAYLLRHAPRSPAELVRLMEVLSRRAQAERRVVSVPLAGEVLRAAAYRT